MRLGKPFRILLLEAYISYGRDLRNSVSGGPPVLTEKVISSKLQQLERTTESLRLMWGKSSQPQSPGRHKGWRSHTDTTVGCTYTTGCVDGLWVRHNSYLWASLPHSHDPYRMQGRAIHGSKGIHLFGNDRAIPQYSNSSPSKHMVGSHFPYFF